MKIIQSIMTKNPCYKAGKKITVKGLMLHSIGCPQPDANVFVKNWNSASHTNSCVHAFVDGLTGSVYQTLPWNYRGWHCASGTKGSGNNTHIGVEMCEPDCIKYTSGSNFTCSDKKRAIDIAERTYRSAVELFAYLCEQYKLDPLEDGVILGHAEGYKRGIASNHGDPEHMWKQLGMGYTMDTFRKEVKKKLSSATSNSGSSTSSTSSSSNSSDSNKQETSKEIYRVRKTWADASSQIGAYSSLANAKNACKAGYSVYDSKGNWVYAKSYFSVKVTIKDLHIREKADSSSKSNGYIKPGTYTITKVSGKWGYLKSGAGWIHLNYATKL